jgi:hypothetical protein
MVSPRSFEESFRIFEQRCNTVCVTELTGHSNVDQRTGVSITLLKPNGIDPLTFRPRQFLAFAGLDDVKAVHRLEATPQLTVEIAETAPRAGEQLIQVHAVRW